MVSLAQGYMAADALRQQKLNCHSVDMEGREAGAGCDSAGVGHLPPARRFISGVLRRIDGGRFGGTGRQIVLFLEFGCLLLGPHLDPVREDVRRHIGRILDRLREAAGEIAAKGAGAVARVSRIRLIHIGVVADEFGGDFVVGARGVGRIGSLHTPKVGMARADG